jgi:hypothetical protein
MEANQTLPRTLSHYTTIPGMMGIVASKCLWASNASFLNDRTELLHALGAARTAIEKLTSSSAMSRWEPMLERVVRELEDGKIPETFVTCFCRDDDNLSQWRGYGGQEQGIGITFDRAALSARLKRERAKLYRVTYAKITTPSKVREALKGELADLADLDDVLGGGTPDQQYADLFARVSGLLPKFKHLGFRDEKEWRFVVQRSAPESAPCFRAGRGRIVPYIELGKNDERLPITSVRVGPGDDQALTAQSIRPFLAFHGYKNVKIETSDIPFRN